MNWIRIYFDLVSNLFIFFTMELFAEYKLNTFNPSEKHKLRVCYLIFYLLYSIPGSLPAIFISLDLFVDYIYFFLIGQKKTKSCFIVFLKYRIYVLILYSLLYISHTFLINDFYFLDANETYDNAKSVICATMLYVVLFLDIYGKRLSALHEKKHYGIYFSAAAVFSCYILSYFSLFLVGNPTNISRMFPVIFSLFFIIIAVCLTSYQKIVLTLKTNADQEILITRYEAERAYYEDVEKSLNDISSLRHDFRNHLLVLDSYAQKGDLENLKTYIAKLNKGLTDIKLIKSQSSLVSAILNAKSNVCCEKKILFTAKCTFPYISISDFHLITILGNLLDNAITAASKISDGQIILSIRQVDSYLEICCENNHAEKIRKKNEQFLTTKEGDHIFHGIGIKNIKKSVNELNGTIDIKYTDNTFTVNVFVPNYR